MSRHIAVAFLVSGCFALSAWAEAPAPPPVDLQKVIEAAIANLASDDPVLSTEAYHLLKEIGRPAVLPLSNKLQAKDTSADAKYLICDLLGELRDATSVDVLIPVLKDPQEHVSSVASAAARALGLLADLKAVAPLREALKSNDMEVQYEAIRALGNLRAVEAAPDLRPFLKGERKPTAYQRYLSFAAIEALGKMQDKASVKEIAGWIRSADKEPGTEMSLSHYVIRALESITGEAHGSLTKSDEDRSKTESDWAKWWDEHKKEYGAEEPKPPEPPKEPPKDGEQPKEAPKEEEQPKEAPKDGAAPK